jgi:hypothetical protein
MKKADESEAEYWLAELMYFGAIEGLKEPQNDINTLDDVKHIRRIVKPFLVQWGSMGRVVGREDLDWTGLGNALRGSENEFSILRKEKLIHISFDSNNISDSILSLYENIDSIPYIGGLTALSKILHLFNPEIFMMWDDDIRDVYKKKNNLIRENSKGYLEFLKQAQIEIREALTERQKETNKGIDEVEEEIRARYKHKTLARIIDQYNWLVAPRQRAR